LFEFIEIRSGDPAYVSLIDYSTKGGGKGNSLVKIEEKRNE